MVVLIVKITAALWRGQEQVRSRCMVTTILDTYIQAGILTTLEVNLGVNIMCIKTLILFK